MSRNRTSHRGTLNDTINLYEFLRPICNTGADGRAIYDEGWDDARVVAEAAAAGHAYTLSNVANLRRQRFGALITKAPSKPNDVLLTAIAELEGKIVDLTARITDIEHRQSYSFIAFPGEPDAAKNPSGHSASRVVGRR